MIHSKTGLLLKKDGEWTSDESAAVTFDNIRTLLHACMTYEVKDSEILFRFDDARRPDVRLHLPDAEPRKS